MDIRKSPGPEVMVPRTTGGYESQWNWRTGRKVMKQLIQFVQEGIIAHNPGGVAMRTLCSGLVVAAAMILCYATARGLGM
jgi:hypothetical protein